jgi:hypothetical protein
MSVTRSFLKYIMSFTRSFLIYIMSVTKVVLNTSCPL